MKRARSATKSSVASVTSKVHDSIAAAELPKKKKTSDKESIVRNEATGSLLKGTFLSIAIQK